MTNGEKLVDIQEELHWDNRHLTKAMTTNGINTEIAMGNFSSEDKRFLSHSLQYASRPILPLDHIVRLVFRKREIIKGAPKETSE